MTPESAIIGFFFMFLVTIVSVIRLNILQHQFYNYLRKNHFEKWKELTTIFGFGPGMVNGKKALKFILKNDNDIDDPEYFYYKIKCRNALTYVITGIGAIFITFFIAVYACTKK